MFAPSCMQSASRLIGKMHAMSCEMCIITCHMRCTSSCHVLGWRIWLSTCVCTLLLPNQDVNIRPNSQGQDFRMPTQSNPHTSSGDGLMMFCLFFIQVLRDSKYFVKDYGGPLRCGVVPRDNVCIMCQVSEGSLHDARGGGGCTADGKHVWLLMYVRACRRACVCVSSHDNKRTEKNVCKF